MATTLSLTSSYAGKDAAGYIAAAILEANTLAKGGVTVKQNVKFKEVIKKLATDANVIKNGGCDFDATGTVTLTERIIQPEEFQVNMQFCTKEFIDSWEAESMGFSAYNEPPKDFTAFVMSHVAELVSASTETGIWEGVNSNAGQFDGLVTLALADSDVIDVASHAAVDSSNVIAKLGSIVDAIPSTLYGKEDLHLYISQNIARAYVRALGGFASVGSNGYEGRGTNQDLGDNLMFDGVKLFIANGLNDDTAMAAQKSNLYFGTGLLSDYNQAKIIDMSDIDGSQNFRVIMRYTAGVQYGIGSEIVLYHA